MLIITVVEARLDMSVLLRRRFNSQQQLVRSAPLFEQTERQGGGLGGSPSLWVSRESDAPHVKAGSRYPDQSEGYRRRS